MTILEAIVKVGLPLAAIIGISILIRRYIPDTPLTRSGCGG